MSPISSIILILYLGITSTPIILILFLPIYPIPGDNIHTATAIARQCGILTEGGLALEGPIFRNMTPRQLDEVCFVIKIE